MRREGGGAPRCIPPYGVPPGRGRGEQPNAFQISCKWLGRVIHIKLIKPLLVSQGRNPDVAVYLFWISPFFFFFPFNIFFQEIFKGTGTPRRVWQQGLAGAGCLRHIWSWSVGVGRGALTSQGVGQISGSSFRTAPRGGRSWHCRGCCEHFGALQLCPRCCTPAAHKAPRCAQAPLSALHRTPQFPPLYREATIPVPALLPLGAASNAWVRILGAPSHRWQSWAPVRQTFRSSVRSWS